MSFVIAISDGEKIVMGADSQVTYDDGEINHNYQKINQFNSKHGGIAIAHSGDVLFCQTILENLSKIPKDIIYDMSSNDYATLILSIANSQREIKHRHFNCHGVFIIGDSNLLIKNKSCVIHILNLTTNSWQSIYKGNDPYFYAFSSSSYISNDAAERIIIKNLYHKGKDNLVGIVKDIVLEVADIDPSVDKNLLITIVRNTNC